MYVQNKGQFLTYCLTVSTCVDQKWFSNLEYAHAIMAGCGVIVLLLCMRANSHNAGGQKADSTKRLRWLDLQHPPYRMSTSCPSRTRIPQYRRLSRLLSEISPPYCRAQRPVRSWKFESGILATAFVNLISRGHVALVIACWFKESCRIRTLWI